jgi:hypothetical protein
MEKDCTRPAKRHRTAAAPDMPFMSAVVWDVLEDHSDFYDRQERYIHPWDAVNLDPKPLFGCPTCGQQLYLRAVAEECKRRPHFSHFPHGEKDAEGKCTRFSGPTESELHKEAKVLVARFLQTGGLLTFARARRCKHPTTCRMSVKMPEGGSVVVEPHMAPVDGAPTWRPDVAVLDAHGAVCAVVEVFNTHKTGECSGRPRDFWWDVDAADCRAVLPDLLRSGAKALEKPLQCHRQAVCEACVEAKKRAEAARAKEEERKKKRPCVVCKAKTGQKVWKDYQTDMRPSYLLPGEAKDDRFSHCAKYACKTCVRKCDTCADHENGWVRVDDPGSSCVECKERQEATKRAAELAAKELAAQQAREAREAREAARAAEKLAAFEARKAREAQEAQEAARAEQARKAEKAREAQEAQEAQEARRVAEEEAAVRKAHKATAKMGRIRYYFPETEAEGLPQLSETMELIKKQGEEAQREWQKELEVKKLQEAQRTARKQQEIGRLQELQKTSSASFAAFRAEERQHLRNMAEEHERELKSRQLLQALKAKQEAQARA